MSDDVSTTPRKPLTPTQRLALFERHKGICSLCSVKIRAGEIWIDEHLRALGLGGSNAPENRGIAHKKCADAKTHGPTGDLATIAKAKRQKMAALGIKSQARPTIQSAGFRKAPPQQRASKPLTKQCFRFGD
jgi:5-methylcytosine-specific restriction protein A